MSKTKSKQKIIIFLFHVKSIEFDGIVFQKRFHAVESSFHKNSRKILKVKFTH